MPSKTTDSTKDLSPDRRVLCERLKTAVRSAVFLIAVPLSPALGSELEISGGGGAINAYQYGGSRVSEKLGGTAVLHASVGVKMAGPWSGILSGRQINYAPSEPIEVSGWPQQRFGSRITVVALEARREWVGVNRWRIHASGGPGIYFLNWARDFWRYRQYVGSDRRSDVLPGVVMGLSLRRQLGQSSFIDLGGEFLVSADLQSKPLGPIVRDFRGLRQGVVRLGLGTRVGTER